MKGKLKFTAVVVCLATFLFPGWTGVLNAQDLVINELNWVTGPDNGQFVELYGEPGLDLSGHSVVFVRPVFQSANVYEAQVDFVVGLDGQSLDADGFALVDGLSLTGNVVGVVLAASPAGDFVEGEGPCLRTWWTPFCMAILDHPPPNVTPGGQHQPVGNGDPSRVRRRRVSGHRWVGACS